MANTKQPSAFRKLKGFTLVELIVVITILAILGTIGFLSIGGYSSRARDSARIGDLAQVSKSLDLSTVISGSYPVPDGSFAVTYSGGAVWSQGTVGALVMQYFKGTIAGGGLNEKPLDPLKNTEYGYSSLAEGKAYQLKAEYEGDLAQNAMGGGFLAGTAHAEAGNPSVAYIRGNFGGLTAKVSTGGMTFVLAVPGILTNSGSAAGASAPIGTLSGSLLFNGKPLRGASTFPPGAVVHSGAKTASNPSGLPASAADLNAMVVALQAAYAGSDIRSNQNIATLMNASSGSFASFGTSLVSAQLGGSAGGGGGGGTVNTLVDGACTGLPTGSVYFNTTASYSLSSASGGTSLNAVTAGYSAGPTANTCQYKCNVSAGYIWNGSSCGLPSFVYNGKTIYLINKGYNETAIWAEWQYTTCSGFGKKAVFAGCGDGSAVRDAAAAAIFGYGLHNGNSFGVSLMDDAADTLWKGYQVGTSTSCAGNRQGECMRTYDSNGSYITWCANPGNPAGYGGYTEVPAATRSGGAWSMCTD